MNLPADPVDLKIMIIYIKNEARKYFNQSDRK